MLRRIFASAAVLYASTTGFAQLPGNPGGPPPAQAPKKSALARDAKARYLVKQLDLTPEQQKQVDGLVESFYKGLSGANQDDMLAQVRVLTEEYKRAEAANDKAETERVTKKLQDLGRGETDEPQFIQNLEGLLTPPQKEELKNAIERLKSNPSGSVRPIDVYRIAVRMASGKDQQAKLEDAVAAFRSAASDSPSPRDPAAFETQRQEQINDLCGKLRSALTPEQAAKFDKRVQMMRPDPAVPQPSGGPAKP